MLGVLIAAAMAASFFLPWVEFFGEDYGPYMIFEADIPWGDLPWMAWGFLASFALAALAVVVGVIRGAAGIFMLAAGALPYGIIASQVMKARNEVEDLGMPLPGVDNLQDLAGNMDVLREYVAIGGPVYFVSAALLVVIGLARLVRGT